MLVWYWRVVGSNKLTTMSMTKTAIKLTEEQVDVFNELSGHSHSVMTTKFMRRFNRAFDTELTPAVFKREDGYFNADPDVVAFEGVRADAFLHALGDKYDVDLSNPYLGHGSAYRHMYGALKEAFGLKEKEA